MYALAGRGELIGTRANNDGPKHTQRHEKKNELLDRVFIKYAKEQKRKIIEYLRQPAGQLASRAHTHTYKHYYHRTDFRFNFAFGTTHGMCMCMNCVSV